MPNVILNDTLLQNLGSVLAYTVAILLGIIASKLSNSYAKRQRVGALYKTINNDVRTRELLSEMRALYDSDRVKLFQFKNGEYYLGGQSEQKLLLTHFATKQGVAAPSLTQRNPAALPLGFITDPVKAISDKNNVVWDVEQDLKNEPFLQERFRADGTTYVLGFAVRDYKARFLGVVFVTWLDGGRPIAHDIPTVRHLVALIGQQISL